LSQGIRKLCGAAIIPRLTAIHRPIYRAVNGRRKIAKLILPLRLITALSLIISLISTDRLSGKQLIFAMIL